MTILVTKSEETKMHKTSHEDIFQVVLGERSVLSYETFYDNKGRVIIETPSVIAEVKCFQVITVVNGNKTYSEKYDKSKLKGI